MENASPAAEGVFAASETELKHLLLNDSEEIHDGFDPIVHAPAERGRDGIVAAPSCSGRPAR